MSAHERLPTDPQQSAALSTMSRLHDAYKPLRMAKRRAERAAKSGDLVKFHREVKLIAEFAGDLMVRARGEIVAQRTGGVSL